MHGERSSKERNHLEFQRKKKFPKNPQAPETQQALQNELIFGGTGLRLAQRHTAWEPRMRDISTGNAQTTSQKPPEKVVCITKQW